MIKMIRILNLFFLRLKKKNLKNKQKLALKEGHYNTRSRADSSSPSL